jgi:hypothetical protein
MMLHTHRADKVIRRDDSHEDVKYTTEMEGGWGPKS